ncbi:hypothetical protein [Streptomyces atratus]|uniref:hypothetical protein n=1 Tax=Streptomyces atratus TaxID=1893 RepID=UPI003248C680
MIEDTGIAGNKHEAEAGRELSWRAKAVGLAAVDIDDAELLHGWRSDPVTAYEIGIWPRCLTATRERIERDSDDAPIATTSSSCSPTAPPSATSH